MDARTGRRTDGRTDGRLNADCNLTTCLSNIKAIDILLVVLKASITDYIPLQYIQYHFMTICELGNLMIW